MYLYSTMSLRKQYNFQNYLKLLFRSPSEVSSREFLLKSHDTVIFRNIRYNALFVKIPFTDQCRYVIYFVLFLLYDLCRWRTLAWRPLVKTAATIPSLPVSLYIRTPALFLSTQRRFNSFFACHYASSSRLFESYNS